MNNTIISKIMMLVAVAALGGCASNATQLAADSKDKPIMSATDAQTMIRVSVRTLPPIADEDRETIVAAN